MNLLTLLLVGFSGAGDERGGGAVRPVPLHFTLASSLNLTMNFGMLSL